MPRPAMLSPLTTTPNPFGPMSISRPGGGYSRRSGSGGLSWSRGSPHAPQRKTGRGRAPTGRRWSRLPATLLMGSGTGWRGAGGLGDAVSVLAAGVGGAASVLAGEVGEVVNVSVGEVSASEVRRFRARATASRRNLLGEGRR